MGNESDTQAATDPAHLAAPGPHPHEAADVRAWAGSDPSLPEGVKPAEQGRGGQGQRRV